jgi:hypothetical protein
MTTEDFSPRTPNMLNDIMEANSKYAETFDKPMTLGAKKKVCSSSSTAASPATAPIQMQVATTLHMQPARCQLFYSNQCLTSIRISHPVFYLLRCNHPLVINITYAGSIL